MNSLACAYYGHFASCVWNHCVGPETDNTGNNFHRRIFLVCFWDLFLSLTDNWTFFSPVSSAEPIFLWESKNPELYSASSAATISSVRLWLLNLYSWHGEIGQELPDCWLAILRLVNLWHNWLVNQCLYKCIWYPNINVPFYPSCSH